MSIPFITAEEAAGYIKNGDNLGLSGFTASGTPKRCNCGPCRTRKAIP